MAERTLGPTPAQLAAIEAELKEHEYTDYDADGRPGRLFDANAAAFAVFCVVRDMVLEEAAKVCETWPVPAAAIRALKGTT